MTDSTFNTDGSKGPDVSAHVTDTEAHGYFTSTLADPAQVRRVAEHLKSCGPCRDRALEMQRKSVSQMGSSQSAGPECFSADVLTEVAAGVFRNDTQQVLDHASSCWHCAELLCADLEAFSGFQTPESAELLSRLRTSSAAWPEKFARESMQAARKDAKSGGPSWLRPAFALAGVAAAGAIALVLFFPRQTDLQRAEAQLAKSYGQQRTIAMRIPEFPHAELKERQVLRSGDVVGDHPPAFREVQRLLAEQKLQAKPITPEWEHVRARMELLEGTDESVYRALRWLERSAQASPERTDLQLDLAVAYYERESRAETPNMMRVIDILAALLSRKDLAREDRAAALFNLALAFEKSEAWDLAVAKWEEYLQLDPGSAWSREARAHLDAARKHLPQSRAPSPPNTEDRLDAALRKLLPQKLQSRPETAESIKATAALDLLAADMVKDHRDPWLRDFLTALRPDQTAAALDLSAAVDANATGQYAKVLESARRAERGFTARGNTAGVLRAQFEQVYAYHRFLKGKECLLRANALKAKTDATSYGWIRAQLGTELGICLDFVGDLKGSDGNFEDGLRIASDTHYEVLLLRNLGITASQDRLHGNCDRAWQYSVRGLKSFWGGTYPPVRLFQLYFSMQACAEQQQMWHASEAFMRQAVQVIAQGENKAQIGIAYLRLATAQTVLGMDSVAEKQINTATEYLAQAPSDPTIETYKAAANVTLATLQLRRGQPAAALQVLNKVDSKVLARTDPDFIFLNYYRVLGDVHLTMAKVEEAALAFRKAIGVADRGLATASKDTNRLLWLAETESAYRGLTRTLLRQGKSSEALHEWDMYRSRVVFPLAGLHDKRIAAPEVGVPRSPRLIYASFDDGIQLWVVRGHQTRSHWLPIASADLHRRVQSLLRLCAVPDSDLNTIRAESQHLYRLLVLPAGVEQETELVVETDGVLSGFPFEVLVGETGSSVGGKMTITYSAGRVFESSRPQPGELQPTAQVLILDPVALLPGRSEEIAQVKASFPNVKVMRTQQSSRERVFAEMTQASLVHFVGHSQTVERRPALLLADSDRDVAPMYAEDVGALRFRDLRLVVLAACATDAGEQGLLDPGSFTASLLRAGAGSVVASRWNVDSRATSVLMQRFYRGLALRETPAAALNQARQQVAKVMPHPYYWAGFIVTGNPVPEKGNPSEARSYHHVEVVR